MLKTIPPSFTPDLLALMMSLGHGDELLISDGNFPSMTTGKPEIKRIYLPVRSIDALLVDILKFFPLDTYVEVPLLVMDLAKESGVYDTYRKTLDGLGITAPIGTLERFAFYDRAESAAGIVITSDNIKAGNILLKKGVV